MDNMTRESFVRWWGARTLPSQLQVIPYHGNGLGDAGEAVRVWHATATETMVSNQTLRLWWRHDAVVAVLAGVRNG